MWLQGHILYVCYLNKNIFPHVMRLRGLRRVHLLGVADVLSWRWVDNPPPWSQLSCQVDLLVGVGLDCRSRWQSSTMIGNGILPGAVGLVLCLSPAQCFLGCPPSFCSALLSPVVLRGVGSESILESSQFLCGWPRHCFPGQRSPSLQLPWWEWVKMSIVLIWEHHFFFLQKE